MEYYSELLSFCTLKWDSFKIKSPVLLKLSCDGAFLGIDCRVEEISTIYIFFRSKWISHTYIAGKAPIVALPRAGTRYLQRPVSMLFHKKSNIKVFCNVILINFNRHAYYFLKYISYNNQCDKSSNCHLWSINRNNIFSDQWVQKVHGQVFDY